MGGLECKGIVGIVTHNNVGPMNVYLRNLWVILRFLLLYIHYVFNSFYKSLGFQCENVGKTNFFEVENSLPYALG